MKAGSTKGSSPNVSEMYAVHEAQREFALLLSWSGGTVANKKTGGARWNLEDKFRLAEMFCVSLGYMVGEEPLESAVAVNAKTAEGSSTVFAGGASFVAGAGYDPATSRL
ncbi:hypothetical protein GCM10027022_19810 [Alpinimonas psychrophila]